MADEATTTAAAGDGGTAGTTTPKDGGSTTTTSAFTQEDVDRIVGDRLAREREKYADFDALKTKAEEFDKLSESQKTEAQKEADRAQKAEGRATQAELKLMRFEVAAEKGLDLAVASALAGTTKDEIAANADLILGATKGGSPGEYGAGQGRTAPTNDMDSMIRRAAGYGST